MGVNGSRIGEPVAVALPTDLKVDLSEGGRIELRRGDEPMVVIAHAKLGALTMGERRALGEVVNATIKKLAAVRVGHGVSTS